MHIPDTELLRVTANLGIEDITYVRPDYQVPGYKNDVILQPDGDIIVASGVAARISRKEDEEHIPGRIIYGTLPPISERIARYVRENANAEDVSTQVQRLASYLMSQYLSRHLQNDHRCAQFITAAQVMLNERCSSLDAMQRAIPDISPDHFKRVMRPNLVPVE